MPTEQLKSPIAPIKSFAQLQAMTADAHRRDGGSLEGIPDECSPDLSEETIYPSDKRWVARIYVDETRVEPELQPDRLLAQYAATEEFKGWTFVVQMVHPQSLHRFRLSRHTLMEASFFENGYVSDLEFRRSSGKGNPRDSGYFQEQKRTVDVAVYMLGVMLKAAGPGLFDWNGADAGRIASTNDKVIDCLEQLSGSQNLRRPRRLKDDDEVLGVAKTAVRRKYGLVEYQGLLLGCHTFQPNDLIHFAYGSSPRTERFRKTHDEQPVFGSSLSDVRKQIEFELKPEASKVFFSAANFQQGNAEERDNRALLQPVVTPAMILAWFSQILGVMRKAAWCAERDELSDIAKDFLHREASALATLENGDRAVPIGAVDLKAAGFKPASSVQDRVEQIASDWLEDLPKRGMSELSSEQTVDTLSYEQLLVALLHGAGSDTWVSEGERPEPCETLMSWVGQLKRRGLHTLSPSIAYDLVVLADERLPAYLEGPRMDLLSWEVWSALVDAAHDVVRTRNPIEVEYHWSRDLERPWAVERQNEGRLVIRGPLLSFPALDASYWTKVAQFLRENGDFTVPLRR
ncbi:hypothetical protein [Aureimonas sp. D3]|uniref:hypothetical protein n=1 Tax=Aureimonas sp. D3 TaxID=1638164 RepID=UPI001AEC3A28|nr:hypothetical protein [Aureimonas sp. D3]